MKNLVLVLIVVATFQTQTDPETFMSQKVKTVVNNAFSGLSFAVTNIPYFPDITLDKVILDDFKYEKRKHHHLTLTASFSGSFIAITMDTTLSLEMQLKTVENQTIPVSYKLKFVKGGNRAIKAIESAVNRVLKELIGQPLPYNVFPSYLKVDKGEEGEGYRVNYDLNKYLEEKKKNLQPLPEQEEMDEQEELEEQEIGEDKLETAQELEL